MVHAIPRKYCSDKAGKLLALSKKLGWKHQRIRGFKILSLKLSIGTLELVTRETGNEDN